MTKRVNIDYKVGIIGGGFGGLGLAIKLKERGINDFVIFEQAKEVGGVWRDNIYPGCGCDIPSHLYSFSFELNPNWTRAYSKQPEILDYIIDCKKKYQLEKHIRFDTCIKEAVFSEKEHCWKIIDQKGNEFKTQLLVSATGALNVPKLPEIEGIESFSGKTFHSSEWDKTVDLTNKKVAIIGTGASAIQIVPEIVSKVSGLSIYQRTAPWILPKNDGSISKAKQELYKRAPSLQRIRRSGLYWYFEAAGKALFSENAIRRYTKKLSQNHLKKQVKDSVLRKKLTPNYEIGCKRRLPSDEYYPALTQDNVSLITDSVQEIKPDGILDSTGTFREVDVIIFATGFYVTDFSKKNIKVLGRDGTDLMEQWTKYSPQAYYGTFVSGYPGLIFILGPNTGLGHNSQLHVIESQYNLILDYINEVDKLSSNAHLNLKRTAQTAFNQDIQQKLKTMVWSSGGCNSWYLDKHGQNSTLWPGYTSTFRKLTKELKKEDFEVIK